MDHNNDHTFKSLTNLMKNQNIVVLLIHNEFCIVLLNKVEFIDKINKIIDEGIANGK